MSIVSATCRVVLLLFVCCSGGVAFSPTSLTPWRARTHLLRCATQRSTVKSSFSAVRESEANLDASLCAQHRGEDGNKGSETEGDQFAAAEVLDGDARRTTQRRALLRKAAAMVPVVLTSFSDIASAKESDLVLVLGATGPIGQYVSRELISRGYRVRGVTRYKEEAERVLGNKVDWVSADLNDAKSLAGAMPGVRQVIFAAGAHGWEDIENNRRIYCEAVGELARLGAAQGLKKFVLISSGGVTQQGERRSKYLTDVLSWKLKGEDLLRSSGVPYAIVRAYSLAKEKNTGLNSTSDLLLFQGDRIEVGGLISRHDLAVLAVEAMETAPPKSSFEVMATEQQFFECDKGTCVARVCGNAELQSDPLSRAPECDADWRSALRSLRQDPLSP